MRIHGPCQFSWDLCLVEWLILTVGYIAHAVYDNRSNSMCTGKNSTHTTISNSATLVIVEFFFFFFFQYEELTFLLINNVTFSNIKETKVYRRYTEVTRQLTYQVTMVKHI